MATTWAGSRWPQRVGDGRPRQVRIPIDRDAIRGCGPVPSWWALRLAPSVRSTSHDASPRRTGRQAPARTPPLGLDQARPWLGRSRGRGGGTPRSALGRPARSWATGSRKRSPASGRTPRSGGRRVPAAHSLCRAPTITAAKITADLTGLQSDDARRDGQFARRGLETSTYPTATFVLGQPVDLDSIPSEGQIAKVQATGQLTLHGQAGPCENADHQHHDISEAGNVYAGHENEPCREVCARAPPATVPPRRRPSTEMTGLVREVADGGRSGGGRSTRPSAVRGAVPAPRDRAGPTRPATPCQTPAPPPRASSAVWPARGGARLR